MADDTLTGTPYGWMMNIPEVADILREWQSGGHNDAWLQGHLEATDWWKHASASERAYEQDQNTDPASFNQKLDVNRNLVRDIAGKNGYNLDQGYIDYFANQAYKRGLSPADLAAMMADETIPLQGVNESSPLLAQLRQASQDYGIVLDQPTQNNWLRELASGRQTIDNLRNNFRQQVQDMFPNLTNQFQQGMTFRQITDPYKKVIASTLEVDPEQIDFIGNEKWRNTIAYVDPKTGITRPMSSVELGKYVRSQDEWKSTQNAQDVADKAVRQLQQTFGA